MRGEAVPAGPPTDDLPAGRQARAETLGKRGREKGDEKPPFSRRFVRALFCSFLCSFFRPHTSPRPAPEAAPGEIGSGNGLAFLNRVVLGEMKGETSTNRYTLDQICIGLYKERRCFLFFLL